MFKHEPIDLGYEDLSTTNDGGRKYQTPKGNYPSITTLLGCLLYTSDAADE